MFLTNNDNTFSVAVGEFLTTMCSENENVVSTSDEGIYLSNTGIKKLSIGSETYIVALLFENKEVFERSLMERCSFGRRYVVIVNAPESSFEGIDYKNYLPNIRFLYAPQLLKKIKFKKKEYKCTNPQFSVEEFYKKKCLHYERFEEFLHFIIRFRILNSIMIEKKDIIPDCIVSKAGQKSVLPFVYEERGNMPIFIYETSDHLKSQFYKEYVSEKKAVLVKLSFEKPNKEIVDITIVSVKNNDSDGLIRHHFKEHSIFERIRQNMLPNYINVFNKVYGSFFIDDFIDLYKYRKFEKTRYNSPSDDEGIISRNMSLYKYPESFEIEIGSRGALENDTIWFSNYEQLNDPFDLLVRVPKVIEKTPDDMIYAKEYSEKSDYSFLTFCVTSKPDNILMWSHYGWLHEGTCTSYPMIDILKAIEADKQCAICFYGNIKYSRKRPTFSLSETLYRFIGIDLAFLMFNIISMFNKYKDWGYEREFRFLILPERIDDPVFAKGHGMILKPKDLFLGKNFNKAKYEAYLNRLGYSELKKYKLSDDKYKLLLE